MAGLLGLVHLYGGRTDEAASLIAVISLNKNEMLPSGTFPGGVVAEILSALIQTNDSAGKSDYFEFRYLAEDGRPRLLERWQYHYSDKALAQVELENRFGLFLVRRDREDYVDIDRGTGDQWRRKS